MPIRPTRIIWALLAALLLPTAAKAAGMPQLDFANPLTTSQVVWGAIIFAVLYIVLSRIALPKVGAVIEERARHIAADLETAQAAKARADEAAHACRRGDSSRAGRSAGGDQCGARYGEAGGVGAHRCAQ